MAEDGVGVSPSCLINYYRPTQAEMINSPRVNLPNKSSHRHTESVSLSKHCNRNYKTIQTQLDLWIIAHLLLICENLSTTQNITRPWKHLRLNSSMRDSPRQEMTRCNWSTSDLPGNIGLPMSISPAMQPTAQISIPLKVIPDRRFKINLSWGSGHKT